MMSAPWRKQDTQKNGWLYGEISNSQKNVDLLDIEVKPGDTRATVQQI